MGSAAAQAETDSWEKLGGCPSTQQGTCARLQVPPVHDLSPTCSFHTQKFGSFKTNKGLQKQQYSKAEVLRGLIRLPPHVTEYSTESEINLKKRLQESRSKAKGNCTSFLQDSAASRTGSERAQLLTLSLEKFHERFKLCVDENHHVQGVELRSWSLNLRNPRSCRKVTVFRTEPVQTLHARLLFSRLSPSAFLSWNHNFKSV